MWSWPSSPSNQALFSSLRFLYADLLAHTPPPLTSSPTLLDTSNWPLPSLDPVIFHRAPQNIAISAVCIFSLFWRNLGLLSSLLQYVSSRLVFSIFLVSCSFLFPTVVLVSALVLCVVSLSQFAFSLSFCLQLALYFLSSFGSVFHILVCTHRLSLMI